MQQSGEYRIAAPREQVWAALNDPDVLRRSIDGCESLTKTADDSFEAVVKARVGPLSATFTGEVKLADLNPPASYVLEVNAKGGAAGFGRGKAKVSLAEDGPSATVLTYDVEGNVGGKLAQIGQRLIDAAARKTADDFFERFRAIVAPPAAEPAGEEQALPSTPTRRNASLFWIAAVAAAAAAIAGAVMLNR
jgi:carbon monoxide dehydrogenase subunit G